MATSTPARGTREFLLATRARARVTLLFYFLYSSLISSPIMPALSLLCRERGEESSSLKSGSPTEHTDPSSNVSRDASQTDRPDHLRRQIIISTIVPRTLRAYVCISSDCHQRLRACLCFCYLAEFPRLCNIFQSHHTSCSWSSVILLKFLPPFFCKLSFLYSES